MKSTMTTNSSKIALSNLRDHPDILSLQGKLKTIATILNEAIHQQQTLHLHNKQAEESLLGILEEVCPAPQAKVQAVYCQYSGAPKCMERFWPKDQNYRAKLEEEGWVCNDHKRGFE